MAFRVTLAASLLAALLAGPAAHATIISGFVTGGSAQSAGGVFVELTPPFTESDPDSTVGNNNFDDPNLYAFNEDQNIQLPTALDVDIHQDGSSTSLPAGATVASHYIVFDPQDTEDIQGSVTFDSAVIAIITDSDKFSDSDGLANPGVNYQNPLLRGLESADSISINGSNPNRVDLDFTASSPGDVVRVLTDFSPAAIPAPSVAAGGLALFTLLGLRRRA